MAAFSWLSSPVLPRMLPFAVYIFFVALGEVGDLTGLLPATPESQTLLYPLKVGCTALALCYCLPRCPEVRACHLAGLKDTALSVGAGLFVFFMDSP